MLPVFRHYIWFTVVYSYDYSYGLCADSQHLNTVDHTMTCFLEVALAIFIFFPLSGKDTLCKSKCHKHPEWPMSKTGIGAMTSLLC